jgi:hypothetical protein
VLSCAGCQLVSGLNKLETGSGGAGGTGGVIGTSVTTGNATSSTTHSTATGTSSTTSKTTGAFTAATTSIASTTTAATSSNATTTTTSTGGGLVPCGNVTDTLQTLNMQTWLTSNAQQSGSEVQINGSMSVSGFIKLQTSAIYDECYVTIELANQQAQTTAWNAIVDTSNPTVNFTEIGFSQSNQTIFTNTDGMMTAYASVLGVFHLGIALHAGSVYFLHANGGGGSWTLDGSVARPAWLNGGTDTANISVTATTAGTRSVYFRNFNIKPIALTDLP